MQKLLNKFLAIVISTILIVIEFAPATVQAAEDIQNMQDSSTSQENVEFSASVNGKENVEVDILDEIELAFDVKVSNTGYLKNASIKISDSNFTVDKNTVENVNEIDEDGKIILNEIRAEENVQSKIKAHFTKNENVKASDFNKDSKITFNAVYVNGEGKEKKIEKEVKLNVTWTSEKAEETIYQELIRYIRFDNKTMISFRVNDEIKDSLVPIKNKEVRTNVPQINKSNPTVVNIVGDYDEYVQEGNELVIKRNELKVKDEESEEDTKDKKKNEEKEDEYTWKSDDSYIVTFIYDAQENIEVLKGSASSKVTTILDKELKANTEIENEVTSDVGSLVELDLEGTNKLNKGYMYTNISREEKINTEFNIAYKINVGMKDIVDKVVLKENDYAFNEYKTNAISTKVNTHVEELTKVLGEEGYIKVQDKEGNELGILNKDTEEITITSSELTFITSKPEAEGIVTINVDKKIDDSIGYKREDIKLFNTLNTYAVLEGYMGENVLSSKQFVSTIALEEPVTSADVRMEPTTLSTVVENQDVEINVRLNTADVEDALFTNPEIRVKLPDQVTGINITEGSLIYDSELKPADLRVEGNMIIAKLSGTQTIYNSDGMINGSIVKILANVQMNNMATTSDEKIIMAVANEATGEIDEKTIDAEVVAPSEFIATNTIAINGVEKTAFLENKDIQINQGAPENVARIAGKVINNLENNADEFTIMGRIPTEGIQDFEGNDLQTTITTNLRREVNVRDLNAKVYYSENANETMDGAWSETPTATSKSFKIVAEEDVPHGKEVNFDYDITIPANVESGKDFSSIFGVVYATHAVEGEQYRVYQAKQTGAFTEGDDILGVQVDVYDKNDETKVVNSENRPTEGQDVTYKITVTNKGRSTIDNVRIDTKLNERLNFLKAKEVSDALEPELEVTKDIKSDTITIGSMAAGEVKEYYYNVRYNIYLDKDEACRIKLQNKINNKELTEEEKQKVLQVNGITQSWDDYTRKMYEENIPHGFEGEVYDSILNPLYEDEYNRMTDEEVANYNKAIVSINGYYNNRERPAAYSNELIIQKKVGAYIALTTKNQGYLQENDTMDFKVSLRNASMERTGKLETYINIPEDLEVVSINAKSINTDTDFYDSQGNRQTKSNLSNYYERVNGKINYNKLVIPTVLLTKFQNESLDNLEEVSCVIKVKAKGIDNTKEEYISADLKETQYTIVDNAKQYGDSSTITSNSLKVSIEGHGAITARQYCSVEGSASDVTPVEFRINIISTSKKNRTISISDVVPEGLEVTEVVLHKIIDGKDNAVHLAVSQSVNQAFEIAANSEMDLVIVTVPKRMLNDESDLFTNSPSITADGNNIDINEISVKIYGTVPKDKPVVPTPTPEDPIPPEPTNDKFSINGVVWLDEDYNGVRGVNDKRLKGNTIYLYKKIINNGKITDIELVRTTESNGLGEYSFNEVSVGSYFVVADYDTKEYIVTKYKVKESKSSNDNDFTEETLNGKKVAATSLNVTTGDLYNIDLGLATRKNFCFKLDKYVTGAKILNSEYETREYKFVNKKIAQVQLPSKNVNNTTVMVDFKIKITNTGKVSGKVESIADYLPKGMEFDSSIDNNKGWYLAQDGQLYYTALSQTEIPSGETKEITLTLIKKVNGENLGTFHNITEIAKLSSNSASVPDGQTPGNQKEGEDDMSSADIIILLSTGRETASIIGITVTILALITGATFITKKYVMDKAI